MQQLRARQQALDNQQQDLNTHFCSGQRKSPPHGSNFLAAKGRFAPSRLSPAQAEPLQRRRQQLQAELGQEHTRLQTRLEDLNGTLARLQAAAGPGTAAPGYRSRSVSKPSIILSAVGSIKSRCEKRARNDGKFMETLQANQRTCEAQLARVEQKLQLLHAPDAICPLCDRPLGHPAIAPW